MATYEGYESSGSGAMLAFVCGALVGASAALLLAPMRGAEMRASIGDRTRQGRDRLRDYTQTSRAWASNRVNEASEISRSAIHRATEAVDAAVDRAQTAVNQGATRAHDATERTRSALGRSLETARGTAADLGDTARGTVKDIGDKTSGAVRSTKEQWS